MTFRAFAAFARQRSFSFLDGPDLHVGKAAALCRQRVFAVSLSRQGEIPIVGSDVLQPSVISSRFRDHEGRRQTFRR